MKIRYILLVCGIAAVAFTFPVLRPPSNVDSYPDAARLGPVPSTPSAIALFQSRVGADPNVVDLTLLAQLHSRRSRETGDLSELARAEAALTMALGQQPGYAPALSALASVLFAQHRFDEALDTARHAHDLNPRLGALALVGDVLVATGDYQEAAASYEEASRGSGSPGLSARTAHLHELNGRMEEAIALMERAAAAHLSSGGVGEEAAWYQVRLGDLNFTVGRLDESERRYRAALDLFPGYWSALAGVGKVAAARGDLEGSIELYERAAAAIPRPEIMAALGDLYTLTGRADLAEARYETVEVIAQLAGRVYDRSLSLFFADHGRPGEALMLADAGLRGRQDVYAYDAQGWALYRLGRYEEARRAIDRALVLGTRDPQLWFHAGAISLSLGETDRAAVELAGALDMNPRFHPLLAIEAERLLEEARG